jgi:murein DD-endopeptidase MepM/ murein hydrolase activator NlpD
MRFFQYGVFSVFLFFSISAHAFTLDGNLIQGGMVIGQTDPDSTLFFQGKKVRVSPEGVFVIGFSRDADFSAEIEVQKADGTIEKHPVEIKQRAYEIQKIDGLPKRKVSPSKEDLDRIYKDIALVKAVRKKDVPRTDFAQPFIWPVLGRISGVYGSQRILNGKPKRPHYGVDIAAPIGTPVKAPADGVVSLAHDDMFYSGGTLIVDHGHGVTTCYLHLHKILVIEGQSVKQGEVIAQVGATGRATGPHLHWGLNWFSTRLDPSLLVPPMSDRSGESK